MRESTLGGTKSTTSCTLPRYSSCSRLSGSNSGHTLDLTKYTSGGGAHSSSQSWGSRMLPVEASTKNSASQSKVLHPGGGCWWCPCMYSRTSEDLRVHRLGLAQPNAGDEAARQERSIAFHRRETLLQSTYRTVSGLPSRPTRTYISDLRMSATGLCPNSASAAMVLLSTQCPLTPSAVRCTRQFANSWCCREPAAKVFNLCVEYCLVFGCGICQRCFSVLSLVRLCRLCSPACHGQPLGRAVTRGRQKSRQCNATLI